MACCVSVKQGVLKTIVFRRQNLAAWTLAGTVAYYLWVKPERKAEAERRVGALHTARGIAWHVHHTMHVTIVVSESV